MNRIVNNIVLLPTIALACVGCALSNSDAIDKAGVKVETVPANDVKYLYTNVDQEGVKVIIYGTVALNNPSTVRDVPSHLDVYVRDGTGRLLMVSYTPYLQHHHPGKGNQVNYYTAARLLVPDNATVTLRHHFGEMSEHENESQTG